MREGLQKGARRVTALFLLCLFCISLAACADSTGESSVLCADTPYSTYPEAIADALPDLAVKRASPLVFTYLHQGAAAEAFDYQAASALEGGLAKYWYPQYLATVVIALDRDRTDARIERWSDLPDAGESVGFADSGGGSEVLISAMAYGLEGERFTLAKAAELLAGLYEDDRLLRGSYEEPVIICFDYQAAALKKSGRNLEIVVPGEGTLTYTKGILSNKELSFKDSMEEKLLSQSLRLPGGECDTSLYPEAAAYESAHALEDFTRLNEELPDTWRVLRRDVFRTRLYSSADAREHQFFVLLYIVLVIVWTASFIQRAMQKGVRRAALAGGIILLAWIAVRLLKYQFAEANAINRFFWYAFYLFQLSLPLVLLWLSWAIDRQDERLGMPGWLRALSAVNAALVVLVFTNDLHGLVFRLDAASPNWSSEYEYGPGYYVLLAVCVLQLLAALVMLMVKSGRSPRKKGFAFPLALCALLLLYGYGYIMRIPLAWDSDLTMVVGLLTLLFIESAFRTRLIPVNSKYAPLFANSPLRMQIFDSGGRAALGSKAAADLDGTWLARALAASPLPAERDADTLLFAAPITGGTALWQEDISALNRLQQDIEQSVEKLASANAVLAEEEKIRRALDEEKAKTRLMEQLEAEIAGHTERLEGMIASLGSAAERPGEMLQIALLLCYIKRRCNLFFRQRETQSLPADELRAYIEELAELSGYGEGKMLVSCDMRADLPVHTAKLIYDFFYAASSWAVQRGCLHMLVSLGLEGDCAVLRLLPSEDARSFSPEPALEEAVAEAGGGFVIKDLDGAVGISLSLPKGGTAP